MLCIGDGILRHPWRLAALQGVACGANRLSQVMLNCIAKRLAALSQRIVHSSLVDLSVAKIMVSDKFPLQLTKYEIRIPDVAPSNSSPID
jgi:hypothetical protein